MTESKADVLKRIENLKQALKGHWNNSADIEWIEKYILDLPELAAPAQGVDKASTDYANSKVGDWPGLHQAVRSMIASGFIAGSRWQQGQGVGAKNAHTDTEAKLEQAMKDMKILADMVSEAYDPENKRPKKCTKPNCNCIDIAEKRNGGPVKSYQCLADINHDFTQLKQPQAAPTCCARWVKASERLPEESKHKQWYVVRQSNNTRSARTYWWDMISKDIEQFVKLPLHNIEWLDESAAEQGMDDSISGFIGDKKKGSKWVIQDCINGHQFEIGTIVTIIAVDEEDYYATDGKKSWYVRDNELSHINGIK